MRQILDLERLKLTGRNNQGSLIHKEVQTAIYSNKCNTSGKLSEDLDQHCRHPQGLGIDLQQVERMHSEIVQPFPLPFTQPEHLNPSPSAGIPLHGDSFWQCKSPAQTSEVWSLSFQVIYLPHSCDISYWEC